MNKRVFMDSNYVDPLRMMQRVIDKAIGRTQLVMQKLMNFDDLTPEQIRDIDIVRMTELAMLVRTKNLSELYAEDDMISALRMRAYSAPKFLTELANQVIKTMPDDSIAIDVECGEDCKSVIFDSMRTSIILYNLLANAIVHNKKKKKAIKISAYIRGETFVIRVIDNGRCIPEPKRETLFLKDGITFGDSGNGFGVSGLGLPLCRKAAREMKGDVLYIPSSKDNIFEVTIPQSGREYQLNETAIADVIPENTFMYMAETLLSFFE